jgi:hypothetical protein
MDEQDNFEVVLHEVLSRLTDRECRILAKAAEPLLASIKENLEHSHTLYTRLMRDV